MQMALELAARGRGLTSPNPLVGAVVVNNGVVVGLDSIHSPAGRMPRSAPMTPQAAPRAAPRCMSIWSLQPYRAHPAVHP